MSSIWYVVTRYRPSAKAELSLVSFYQPVDSSSIALKQFRVQEYVIFHDVLQNGTKWIIYGTIVVDK